MKQPEQNNLPSDPSWMIVKIKKAISSAQQRQTQTPSPQKTIGSTISNESTTAILGPKSGD